MNETKIIIFYKKTIQIGYLCENFIKNILMLLAL